MNPCPGSWLAPFSSISVSIQIEQTFQNFFYQFHVQAGKELLKVSQFFLKKKRQKTAAAYTIWFIVVNRSQMVCTDAHLPWPHGHSHRIQTSSLTAYPYTYVWYPYPVHRKSCILCRHRRDCTGALVRWRRHRKFYKYRPWWTSFRIAGSRVQGSPFRVGWSQNHHTGFLPDAFPSLWTLHPWTARKYFISIELLFGNVWIWVSSKERSRKAA